MTRSDLYRETGFRAGHDASTLKVGINSHGFVGDTSQGAAEAFYPGHFEVMTRIGRERGWPPATRAQFEAQRSPRGALLVGSVNEVVDKILFEHEIFQNDRILLQMSVGPMPHATLMHAIELYGTKVAPAVRKAVAQRTSELSRTGSSDRST